MSIMMASVSELKENVNTLSKGIQGSSQSIPAGLGYAWGTSPTLTENVLLLDATGRSLLLPMPFMTSPMVSQTRTVKYLANSSPLTVAARPSESHVQRVTGSSENNSARVHHR
jgi:hypothetical protein